MVAISVIIPVFNAAPQLRRCIDSLLSQTMENCEFLFINDGSTDDSQAIIEEYQKLDSRIILINQHNQGVSSARNAGLQIAKGNYIGFTDADDKVESTMFEILVEMAEKSNADIVVSRYIHYQNGKQMLSPVYFCDGLMDRDFIKSKVIPFMIQTDCLNAIWTKIFRRELLQNNQIIFPVGVDLGEDGLFNIAAFFHAQRIYATDFAGYHYYEVDGSATRNFVSRNYFEAIQQEYQRDYSDYENSHLMPSKITQLKAEKFLNKSVSLIHEYTNPANKLPFGKSYHLISEIVNDVIFHKTLSENYNERMAKKGKYERFILWSAHKKWVLLLFMATAYSRFRNN